MEKDIVIFNSNVLVIDDDIYNGNRVKESLQMYGFNVMYSMILFWL